MDDYRVHLLCKINRLIADLVHQNVLLAAVIYLHGYLPFFAGYKVTTLISLPSVTKTTLSMCSLSRFRSAICLPPRAVTVLSDSKTASSTDFLVTFTPCARSILSF